MSEGLTVVVPAFDEEASLRVVVEDVLRVASSCVEELEVVVVDDASTDGTARVAGELAAADRRVRLVRHEVNQGSGGAILTGVAEARCPLVMYVPADGQFHLEEISDFLRAMADHDVVIGARLRRSDYSAFRLLSSRVFITLVNWLFDQRFRDVNWVHMWRRKVFEKVKPRSRGVFLLEEILVRARRAGFTVAEVDSLYVPRIAGRAKGAHPVTILRTLWEMGVFWLEKHRAGRAR